MEGVLDRGGLDWIEHLDSPAFSWSSESCRQFLRRNACLWLSEKESVLGFIAYREIETATVEILLMAVRLDLQRRGLGRQLLHGFCKNAILQNRQQVWLEVHEKNGPARALYATFGFKEVGRRLSYYRDGAAALNCVLDLSACPL